MRKLCIVGLPEKLKNQANSEAKRRDASLTSLYVGKHPRNDCLWFIPNPEYAKSILDRFTESLEDLEDGIIYVLPYVPIPSEIQGELQAFEELGGSVQRVDAGRRRFPELLSGLPTEPFLKQLFAGVSRLLATEEIPSESFLALAQRDSRFVVTKGSLDTCDAVPRLRYQFLYRCVEAFEDLLQSSTGQRWDQFFEGQGLTHAQSGGITTTLEMHMPDGEVRKQSSQTHLKQGDGTTPASAARVYYQLVSTPTATYVALMYAGTYPSGDLKRLHVLAT